MRGFAFLFRDRICPCQPVEYELPERLDAEFNGPEEPAHAQLDHAHALYEAFLQQTVAAGIKITPQRLFEDVGLGRLGLAGCHLELGEERGVDAQIYAGFQGALRGAQTAPAMRDFGLVMAGAPKTNSNLPRQPRPA